MTYTMEVMEQCKIRKWYKKFLRYDLPEAKNSGIKLPETKCSMK